MAEYFAVPNEIIAIGKNHEWMKPSVRRTLHRRGQAFTSLTHTAGTWSVSGGAPDVQGKDTATCQVFLSKKLNFFSQALTANFPFTEHLEHSRTSSMTPLGNNQV